MPWGWSRRGDARLPALLEIRLFWLVFVESLGLFLFVLSFVLPWSGPGGWFWLIVPAVGALAIWRILLLYGRTLQGSTASELRLAYQRRFFTGFPSSIYPSLAGFIGAFIQQARWVYALGLPFSLAGMYLIAPTARHLASDQQRLDTRPDAPRLLESLLEPLER